MEILDRYFLKLSWERKLFLIILTSVFTAIALIAYFAELTNIVESFLVFVVGLVYADIIKLNYRIVDLEKKK